MIYDYLHGNRMKINDLMTLRNVQPTPSGTELKRKL